MSVEEQVNQIIMAAIAKRASDIHLEPQEQQLVIRFRVDGRLAEQEIVPWERATRLVNRVKIMAGMDITQKRLPQDGHISFAHENQVHDLRASSLPTYYGEKMVLRLLEKEERFSELEQLGFSEEQFDQIQQMIRKPYGMVLITGPTGSGKTTTLYSMLRRYLGKGKNIITLEDPVEYAMDGMTQVQIHEEIGLTFAKGLKSILRQDPDIIMIGEIRDQESAEIAIRLAYTGHLVFASLHTNDSFSAVYRLLDMGIPAFLIASCLNGVISQRLVRRWNGESFQGRLALFEVLPCDEEIRQGILHFESMEELKKHYCQNGFCTIYQDGMHKAALGKTTLEEVMSELGVEG